LGTEEYQPEQESEDDINDGDKVAVVVKHRDTAKKGKMEKANIDADRGSKGGNRKFQAIAAVCVTKGEKRNLDEDLRIEKSEL
jgi:hypothetical protein